MIANPLRASGLIDATALEAGRAAQRANGGLLSDALLKLNLVKEGDFLKVFAELYSTRFVKSDKLKTLKIDLELMEKVGVRLAERLRMCPIRWDEERGDLHVVAAVPLATNLDSDLKKVMPAKTVSVYVATAATVHALIRRWHYREEDAFDAVTANGAGPHELAKPPDSSDDEPLEQSAKTVMVKADDTLTIATLRRENARYRVAQEFHRRVTLERSMEEMIDRILEVIFELLPAEGAAIWLNSGKFATKSKRDAKVLEIPRSVIDQTLISKGGILTNNALVDERFDRSASVMLRGVQSVMSVPLRARNQTLGVLYIDSISQSWAVLSGAADSGRSRTAPASRGFSRPPQSRRCSRAGWRSSSTARRRSSPCCSPTSAASPRCPRRCRPTRWCGSSTASSRTASTPSSTTRAPSTSSSATA